MTRTQEKAFEKGDKLNRVQRHAFKKWEKKGFAVAFTDSSGSLIIKRERRDNRRRGAQKAGRFDYKAIQQNGTVENFYK